ncbi:hypothetical protein BTS2_3019 [Bacillus sp. TS-2]|nr:hypothetical protein BTS2_3019 [Bacillus sp. TS-2]
MSTVIIGGDAAGMSAAMQIHRKKPKENIVILEKGAYFSYAQCGLPYVIEGSVQEVSDLIVRSYDAYRTKFNLDVRPHHEVTEMDSERQIIHGFNHQTKSSFSIPYEKLLIATGASPRMPNIEGHTYKGVFTFKTIPDLEKVMDYMADKEHVTIVGGGYIGLELAEAFVTHLKKVRIVERNGRLSKKWGEEFTNQVEQQARLKGIELSFNETVLSLKGNEQQEIVAIQTDQHLYHTDMVIFAIGIEPNTSFVDKVVEKLDNGALVVNEFLQTNLPSVYAAGDCATQYHRIKEENDYIPLGTHANKQGRIAGMNLAGEKKTFKGVIGTAIFRFFDLTVARTGLSYFEAKEKFKEANKIQYKGMDRAGYFKQSQSILIEIIYDEQSRRLLGAEIIGKEGVDKRVDVLSVALFNEMKVDELEHLDLSYAPPFNGVWDPIQQAARRAKNKSN